MRSPYMRKTDEDLEAIARTFLKRLGIEHQVRPDLVAGAALPGLVPLLGGLTVILAGANLAEKGVAKTISFFRNRRS